MMKQQREWVEQREREKLMYKLAVDARTRLLKEARVHGTVQVNLNEVAAVPPGMQKVC